LVGSGYRAVDLMPVLQRRSSGTAQPPFESLWVQPSDALFPIKAGAVLFVDEPDAEPDPKIVFLFDVELSEPTVVTGHVPLLKTVQGISTEVERIIRSFLPLLH
jgi:hypothetical protein